MKTKIFLLSTWAAVIAALIIFEYFLADSLGIWATTSAQVVALLIAFIAFSLTKSKQKSDFTFTPPPRREVIGSTLVLSGGLLIAMFVRLFMQNIIVLAGLELVLIQPHSGSQISFILLAILLPTFLAEVLHRGIFLPRVMQTFSKDDKEQGTRVLLISAALFAVTALDFAGIFGLFVMGFALSWVVWRGKSLFVPLIFHIIYNALVRGEALLLAAEEPWLIGNFGASMDIWQIVGFAFVAIGVATPSLFIGTKMLNEKKLRDGGETFSLILVTLILLLIGVSISFFAR